MTNTNVVLFPKRPGIASNPAVGEGRNPAVDNAKVRELAGKAVFFFTVVVGAFWPILRWILGIDVFIKFVLMLWRWNIPGAHAGLVFALHFGVLVGLTLLLATYKPKG